MHPKRTIIFDFDGTLADTLPALLAISNRLAPQYGYRQVSDEDIEHLRGKRLREVMRWLEMSMFQFPIIAARVKAELGQEMHRIQPIKSVKAVVQQLSERFALGILTSNNPANVQKFLEAHQMQVFDFIYTTRSLYKKSKVLRRIIREQQLNPQETLYVGDEERDVEAAHRCLLEAVAVTWGANTEAALLLAQPERLIHLPEALLTIPNHTNHDKR